MNQHDNRNRSQTTVLERRTRSRRSADGRGLALDTERREGTERREYVPSHYITVGRVAGPGGWMGAVCSCGEHTVSQRNGAIEDWARAHRREVLAQRALFVYTS